jgi:hypothetical protein
MWQEVASEEQENGTCTITKDLLEPTHIVQSAFQIVGSKRPPAHSVQNSRYKDTDSCCVLGFPVSNLDSEMAYLSCLATAVRTSEMYRILSSIRRLSMNLNCSYVHYEEAFVNELSL